MKRTRSATKAVQQKEQDAESQRARAPPPSPRLEDLRFLSLFTGLGSLEYGLLVRGVLCVAVCEREPKLELYAANQAKERTGHDPVRLGDTGKPWRPEGDLPSFSLVSAGPPCTNITPRGDCSGAAGFESGLVHDVFKFIDYSTEKNERGPKFLVLENVAGATTHPRNLFSKAPPKVCEDGECTCHDEWRCWVSVVAHEVEKRGWAGWAYRTISSESFGCLRRRRVLFLAARYDKDWARTILFAADRPVRDADEGNDVDEGYFVLGPREKNGNGKYERKMHRALPCPTTSSAGVIVSSPDGPPFLKECSTAKSAFGFDDEVDKRINEEILGASVKNRLTDSEWRKAIGNSVDRALADWLAHRMCKYEKPEKEPKVEEPMKACVMSWPAAARGEKNPRDKTWTRFAILASEIVVDEVGVLPRPSLKDLFDEAGKVLDGQNGTENDMKAYTKSMLKEVRAAGRTGNPLARLVAQEMEVVGRKVIVDGAKYEIRKLCQKTFEIQLQRKIEGKKSTFWKKIVGTKWNLVRLPGPQLKYPFDEDGVTKTCKHCKVFKCKFPEDSPQEVKSKLGKKFSAHSIRCEKRKRNNNENDL